jgi:hypothetical protein
VGRRQVSANRPWEAIVGGFIDPDILVEIEATAILDPGD